MTNGTATFTGIATVAVPVSDQDRAKAFFQGLGFEERFDTDLQEGFRWIELAPPGSATSVALVAAGRELPAGIDTGIRLTTADARAAHESLGGRDGLTVDELLDWPTAPLMFSFTDHDGNRFYVTETS